MLNPLPELDHDLGTPCSTMASSNCGCCVLELLLLRDLRRFDLFLRLRDASWPPLDIAVVYCLFCCCVDASWPPLDIAVVVDGGNFMVRQT